MTAVGPILTLNNGVRMLAFGLGVHQRPPEQTVGAVEAALANGYDETRRAFDASLQRLGLGRVDLYLLHWPMPNEWERTVGVRGGPDPETVDTQLFAVSVEQVYAGETR